MYFCVLLTTQGRLNYLERLFESLLHQTYRNFFVLLGDQSAEGELDALLSRYEKNFRIDRHILPQLSLSAARNALLPFVEGDYIYFSDDDSYLAPSTFAIMAQYARKWPRAGALIGSGQSKPGLEKPCAGSLPSRELSAYSVFRNCPSWCIFVKKDVPQLIGFFDENIGVGASSAFFLAAAASSSVWFAGCVDCACAWAINIIVAEASATLSRFRFNCTIFPSRNSFEWSVDRCRPLRCARMQAGPARTRPIVVAEFRCRTKLHTYSWNFR